MGKKSQKYTSYRGRLDLVDENRYDADDIRKGLPRPPWRIAIHVSEMYARWLHAKVLRGRAEVSPAAS